MEEEKVSSTRNEGDSSSSSAEFQSCASSLGDIQSPDEQQVALVPRFPPRLPLHYPTNNADAIIEQVFFSAVAWAVLWVI